MSWILYFYCLWLSLILCFIIFKGIFIIFIIVCIMVVFIWLIWVLGFLLFFRIVFLVVLSGFNMFLLCWINIFIFFYVFCLCYFGVVVVYRSGVLGYFFVYCKVWFFLEIFFYGCLLLVGVVWWLLFCFLLELFLFWKSFGFSWGCGWVWLVRFMRFWVSDSSRIVKFWLLLFFI